MSRLWREPRIEVAVPAGEGEAEAGVRSLGFSVVGILRPSFLVGERPEARPGEKAAIAIGRLLGPLMLGPLRRYRPVDARAVARALMWLAFNAPEGVTVLPSEHIAAIVSER